MKSTIRPLVIARFDSRFTEVFFYMSYLFATFSSAFAAFRFVSAPRLIFLTSVVRSAVPFASRDGASRAVASSSLKFTAPVNGRALELNNSYAAPVRSGSRQSSAFGYKLFNLFFLFNYSQHSTRLRCNFNFELFYVRSPASGALVIDVNKFLSRWKDSIDLLLNVFFYKLRAVVFGSPFFKNEILSLNWLHGGFDISLWRHYFPFFTFKPNTYSKKTEAFFVKLKEAGEDFYIVTDCYYHFKNLYYMRRLGCYTIGLVGVDVNPWLVSYPIVGFFESLVTQLFFLKLVNYVNRLADARRYCAYRSYWTKINTILL